MIGTESKLWQHMSTHVKEPSPFTRIETLTRAGVADIEYVLSPWHGWIELKTSSSRMKGRLTLHSPFTLAQADWLASHHEPKCYLRSWLLVGFTGARTWREFMLFEPQAAIHLAHVRKAPSYVMMRGLKGAFVFTSMDELISNLQGV